MHFSSFHLTFVKAFSILYATYLLNLLLCEFARKKENPSLKRYIAPPSFRYVLNPACGRPTNERKLLG
jgi:hypothetical protein